ncbi:hypothetical protein GLOIN_2v1085568 [Rhizophagus irregularis DAOM 181602=DAOM 197198]|uniref:Uricase n=1 Tax=Rhizophagus irregularis (strain DAOM 181602 / DAOM 197198 / MUCL 43194) TaxID=747089 RepID=A0A2P4QVZ6_RHIID|nr:hypothetical protein GLOIN_2v1085568 [Rhizophagus irregularis DAOM 181602=DAOM 197198]POG81844.1 hypothetical protein GLOIN_2v1085568 [Rhizophagus irregularis DAOM 181602=DAOM 197198]|eukprot:XP_025188710.1 hypothetical protein GLOIN_2v1085568 [Rhizophagus irregularis DAOM 181602=DAOM 197198]
MKNTIYILAKQSSNVNRIEIFATEIGQHFISTYSHVSKANVWISKHKWTRMLVNGKLHDHSFLRDGEDTRNTKVVITKKGGPKDVTIEIESGLKDMLVLKTTGSAFYGFLRDKYTTLQETNDHTFATHNSSSVQATLYLMAKIALEKFQQLSSIHYELPNKHYFTYDLDRFGLKNTGKDTDIYYPVADPV